MTDPLNTERVPSFFIVSYNINFSYCGRITLDIWTNEPYVKKMNEVVVQILQLKYLVKSVEEFLQRGEGGIYISNEIRKFISQRSQMDEEEFLDHFEALIGSKPLWLLGFFYEWGIGTGLDLFKAFRLYQEAAQQNSDIGQLFSGLCLESGLGTDPDAAKAFKYYQISANQHNSCAQVNLGRCYRYGIGVKKDSRCSFYWNKIAKMQGNILASCAVAKCYMNGFGVSKNLFDAIRLLRTTDTERSRLLLASLFNNKQSLL